MPTPSLTAAARGLVRVFVCTFVVAMQALVLEAAAPSGVGAVSNAGILRAN
ncbi:MAG: hypothetical protein IT456_23485 [Planctomycetes bacterium]|jgi:hypothetical protein|nr:hypothetical protein [Planctomycetota bacterium]